MSTSMFREDSLSRDPITGLLSLLELEKNKLNFNTMFSINMENLLIYYQIYGYQFALKIHDEVVKRTRSFFKEYDIEIYQASPLILTIGINILGSEEIRSNLIRDYFDTITRNDFEIDGVSVILRLKVAVATGEDSVSEKLGLAAIQQKKNNENFTVFNSKDDIRQFTIDNLEVAREIKSAVHNNRIKTYFQPIYDNNTGEIYKYECLVRLVLRDGTVVPPAKFLKVAKMTAQYYEITKIVLREAIKNVDESSLDFSVNLSVEDIMNNQQKNEVLSILKRCNHPERMIIEIVESEGISNFKTVNNFIEELKAIGCKVAIDDFGSGYSNFAYLTKLNFDYLKIDGSLINEILSNENTLMIVELIIRLSKSLDKKVIAEFVENFEQFELLKKLNVEYSQGYLFGKPSEVY